MSDRAIRRLEKQVSDIQPKAMVFFRDGRNPERLAIAQAMHAFERGGAYRIEREMTHAERLAAGDIAAQLDEHFSKRNVAEL